MKKYLNKIIVAMRKSEKNISKDNNALTNELDSATLNEKEANKSGKKEKVSKKFIIIASSLTTVGVALAIVLGIFIGQDVFTYEQNYDVGDGIEDDVTKIYSRYLEANKDEYDSLFTPTELVNIGFENVKKENYVHIVTKGNAIAAGVNQQIRGNIYRTNGSYLLENISASSLVHCAWRIYQSNDEAKIYKGKYESLESCDFNVSPDTKPLNEFESLWGRSLARPSILVVSSKTVLESSITKNDDGYEINLSLDPVYGVYRYVKQMVQVSGLSKKPKFDYEKICVHLNKELLITQVDYDEKYQVTLFGNHDTVATMTDVFTYEEITMPSLEQDALYE